MDDKLSPGRYAEGMALVMTYSEYLQAAMRKAQFERMENGEWFASIPGFVGLWATGSTEDEARQELIATLYEWLKVTQQTGEPRRVPDIDGFTLSEIPKRTE